jgi:hypothetical protein
MFKNSVIQGAWKWTKSIFFHPLDRIYWLTTSFCHPLIAKQTNETVVWF